MSTLDRKFKYKVDIQKYMAYTELLRRNEKVYYYRTRSVKIGGKVKKKRVYLGVNMEKRKLQKKEKKADLYLNQPLNLLLTKTQKQRLEDKKEQLKKLPKITFNNRYEAFLAKFTYNSNAIEGNTLTLQETSYLLFEKRTPLAKSLREINEVLNHKKAFNYMLNYKQDITKDFMCTLQQIIVKNTLKKDIKDQIGKYRTHQVYIRGANFIPSKPYEINMQMRSLVRWYNFNKKTLHPLILAAYFHIAFESIHPFIDGNGRTGRMLINFILHKNNYPMINIPNKQKLHYYECLSKAQCENNIQQFVLFLYKLVIKDEVYM